MKTLTQPIERIVIDTPIGRLGLVADGDALAAVELGAKDGPRETKSRVLRETKRQLEEYFAGRRTEFDVPMAAKGTAFQKKVWKALMDVGFGATASYGDVAKAIGRPGSARAVGRANGTNPIPILVPCHRIIGSSGALVGYGGGLPTKVWLLQHEKRER